MIIDSDHETWLSASTRWEIGKDSLGDGLLAEAVGLFAEQTLQRVESELEDLVNALSGRPHR